MISNDYKNSLDLICYSNQKVFKWFDTIIDLYKNIKLVRTNFLVFHRNLLSTLALKGKINILFLWIKQLTNIGLGLKFKISSMGHMCT